MGLRGPKKKLPLIARLEGNPGKRRIEDSGIEALGSPFVPEHLCDDARGCLEVIRLSMPPEVYSALDSFHLAAFAQTWAAMKLCQTEMARPGFKPVDEQGQKSIWFQAHNEAIREMCRLGDRLGLDPKARAALKLPKANQQKEEFDGLIGRPVSSGSSRPSEYQAE